VITDVTDCVPGLVIAIAARPAQFGSAEADVDIIANDASAARLEKPSNELLIILVSFLDLAS
jgi:hypothetical protein